MRIRSISSVASYGATLQEAKEYIKVENTLDDALLSSFISASYRAIKNIANRDFIQTSYSASINGIDTSSVYAGYQDISDLNTGSVSGPWILVPANYSGSISYVVAKGITTLPEDIRVAQIMLVAHWWENRGVQTAANMSAIDFSVQALVEPYVITMP